MTIYVKTWLCYVRHNNYYKQVGLLCSPPPPAACDSDIFHYINAYIHNVHAIQALTCQRGYVKGQILQACKDHSMSEIKWSPELWHLCMRICYILFEHNVLTIINSPRNSLVCSLSLLRRQEVNTESTTVTLCIGIFAHLLVHLYT